MGHPVESEEFEEGSDNEGDEDLSEESDNDACARMGEDEKEVCADNDNARVLLLQQECSVSGRRWFSSTHSRICICCDLRKKSQSDPDDHRDKKSK